MRWKDLRQADPHLQVLVAILALPLGLAVLGAVALMVRAVLRLAGVL